MALPAQSSPTNSDGDRLGAFEKVAADILSHLDLEGTLLSVLNAVVEQTGADIAGILLADSEGKELHMRACTGHRTPATAHLIVHPGQGVAGKVLDDGRPVRVDDYQADPSISRDFADIAQADGTRSAVGAPMVVRGHVIGVAMSWRRRPAVFTDRDVQTLAALANLAAIAVENARLYEAREGTLKELREANSRLEQQNEALRRADEVQDEFMHVLLQEHSLTDVVERVARLLDADVIALDDTGSELAASDGAVGLRDHLLAPNKQGPEGGGTGDEALVVREVTAGGERLARLAVRLHRATDPIDGLLVEHAAMACALALTRERAVLEARTRVRGDFLWDLVAGRVSDEAEARVWARTLEYSLPKRMRVLLVRADPRANESRPPGGGNGRRAGAVVLGESLVHAAEQAARQASGATVLAARRGSLLAMLVPGNEDVHRARWLAEAVVAGLRQKWAGMELSVGVSECVTSVAALPGAYSHARTAMAAGTQLEDRSGVAVFDDLGIFRFLLAPSDRGDLEGFARAVLGPVLDYDRDHLSELTSTVEAYLASDCSLQRTADSIFVHPKTVRYRLDRVQEMTDLDFTRQRDRFDAQLAIAILKTLSLRAMAQEQ
jgi:sugar diacid utilization regulator/putative methionine-R-sulfoxide reductase with GAF domain